MCQDAYENFDQTYLNRAIRRTNMIYGGRNLKADKGKIFHSLHF